MKEHTAISKPQDTTPNNFTKKKKTTTKQMRKNKIKYNIIYFHWKYLPFKLHSKHPKSASQWPLNYKTLTNLTQVIYYFPDNSDWQ